MAIRHMAKILKAYMDLFAFQKKVHSNPITIQDEYLTHTRTRTQAPFLHDLILAPSQSCLAARSRHIRRRRAQWNSWVKGDVQLAPGALFNQLRYRVLLNVAVLQPETSIYGCKHECLAMGQVDTVN